MRLKNASTSLSKFEIFTFPRFLFLPFRINKKILKIKVASKYMVERAEDLKQSLVDFLNFIWSETIGSLEEVLELSNDEKTGDKKRLKITNQQVDTQFLEYK